MGLAVQVGRTGGRCDGVRVAQRLQRLVPAAAAARYRAAQGRSTKKKRKLVTGLSGAEARELTVPFAL